MTGPVLSVSVTEAGRALAERLPYEHHHGRAAETVAQRWNDVDAFVLFLAVGAAVRIVAPYLLDKHRDPAVVCVDEAGRYAVALAGGHRGGQAGANELARAVAACLGAEAVITTATDSAGVAGLDQLRGFVATGDIAAVTRAMLDGTGINVENPLAWPVPLDNDPGATAASVRVTDQRVAAQEGGAVLHPPSLVIGVGTSTAAQPDDLAALVRTVMDSSGLAPESIGEVATIDRRASHPAIVALGYPVRAFEPGELAAIEVPTPSETVRGAVGTPSVCEAAALLAAGPGAELLVPKRSTATATVAIARRRGPRGHLCVVGLGPGDIRHRTPAAEHAVRRAEVVIGYRAYIDQCADLLGPAQQVVTSPIGDEVVRAQRALAEAGAGRRVALVCSGDAGTYAMASIVLELADGTAPIEIVPGVTAASASAAVLGAPLGHDSVAISLSDLLTGWDVIERRLKAAADGDFVVALYNPRSKTRTWQLPAAQQLLLTRRPATTPVGIVTDAGRAGQTITTTTLGQLDAGLVGMTTCVIIGASTTKMVNGRMVTPRGYQPARRATRPMTIHPIEVESHQRLAERVDLSHLAPGPRAVVARVIHATADISYADTMVVPEEAVDAAVAAIAAGAAVVTDVEMTRVGITGVAARCYLDAAVASVELTRSAAAIGLAAARNPDGAVLVIGCAPTALFEALARAKAGSFRPAAIVALPVGFVGAAAAKEAARRSGLPVITNIGEKGGSAVAAAACNALVRLAHQERNDRG